MILNSGYASESSLPLKNYRWLSCTLDLLNQKQKNKNLWVCKTEAYILKGFTGDCIEQLFPNFALCLELLGELKKPRGLGHPSHQLNQVESEDKVGDSVLKRYPGDFKIKNPLL